MTIQELGPTNRGAYVCVDSYIDGVLKGRLYHESIEGYCEFSSLSQMLLTMEQALDTAAFPQSFTALRSFGERPSAAAELKSIEIKEGAAANFAIRVYFRQNASWQGSVRWKEGGKEESFRSALELIFLMDSVLNSTRN